MAYTNDWSNLIPIDHTKFKAMPGTVRQSRADISERLANLFYGFTAGETQTDEGVKTLPFRYQAGDPGATANKIKLYSKLVSAKPELFAQDADGNVLQITKAGALNVPASTIFTGMIVMWSGLIAAIPAGWVFCDGTNSTPDLRDKMIVGGKQDSGGVVKTNISGALTQSGGSATKDLSHTHTYSGTTGTPGTGPTNVDGSSSPVATQNHTHSYSGTTSSNGNASQDVLNPYYALAFIMKS